ncbi:hypothetical protein [Streptodolium elevatio]
MTIAGGAGLTMLAPAANAAKVTAQATCQVPVLGEKKGPQDISVTLTPVTGPGGIEVTANVDLGPPPITAPAEFKDSKAQSTLHLEMSGAATGTVDLVGPEVTLTIPANVPIDPAPFTTTFTVPAGATVGGTITFKPKGSTNVTVLPGLGKQTAPCTYVADAVATFAVTEPDVLPGDVKVAEATVKAGDNVTVSGDNWKAPLGKVQLCSASNVCKDVTGVTRTEADNKIAGTPTIPADTAAGKYKIKVAYADGVSALSNEFTVQAPSISLDPVEGKAGTKVKVTGTDFPAGKDVKVEGLKADGSKTGDAAVTAAAGSDGKFSADFTVNDKDTKTIKATAEGAASEAAFTVKPDDPVGTGDATLKGGVARVEYSCETTGSPIPIPKLDTVLDVTVTVPATAKAGDDIDVKAAFANDVVGKMPSIPGASGLTIEVEPSLAMKVTEAGGKAGSELTLLAPKKSFQVVEGADMKGGPFEAKYKVTDKGEWTFAPDTLTLATTTKLGETALTTKTVCSAKKVTWSPTGPPPSNNNTGGSGSTGGNGASSGDLAKTGSGGSTINAFALVAGTAVLASVGVLLLITRRRRTVAGS